jgi:tetratricopeptide (TPR) repeat protein
MHIISVQTVRGLLFLVVGVVFYFYYPFMDRCFSSLVKADLLKSTEIVEIIVNLAAYATCFIIIPGIFLLYIWKFAKKMRVDFSRTSKANTKGRRKKRAVIAAVDEKSITTNNGQSQQDALAFETKLAALREELKEELRDEIQRQHDMKAEAEACLKKARVLYKAGNYEMALDECSRAIAMAPFAVAFYIRGAINHKLGQDDRAVNDLKEAAKLGHPKAQDFLASNNVLY